MNWNRHSEVTDDEHAFLSPSNYHWLGYSIDKLMMVYKNRIAKEEGTWLHDFASRCIQKNIKLSKSKNTLHMFVNDCIAFRMTSEQRLFYSLNAFGKADAISFENGVLRIFDYKSGSTPTSFKQLDIYAAYFCLEYNVNPNSIQIEERIYQNNEVMQSIPDGAYIQEIMQTVVQFDIAIEDLKIEMQKGM